MNENQGNHESLQRLEADREADGMGMTWLREVNDAMLETPISERGQECGRRHQEVIKIAPALSQHSRVARRVGAIAGEHEHLTPMPRSPSQTLAPGG